MEPLGFQPSSLLFSPCLPCLALLPHLYRTITDKKAPHLVLELHREYSLLGWHFSQQWRLRITPLRFLRVGCWIKGSRGMGLRSRDSSVLQQVKNFTHMMRYISYAIPALVFIYSLDFQANKPQKEASSKTGTNSSSGQSSNSLVTEQGEKSIDPACSIQKPDPKRNGKSSTSKAKKKQQRKRK
ncbi:unnamed protein product [Prunus brigantina]